MEILPSHILLGISGGPHGIGYHALIVCDIDPGQQRDDLLSRMRRCELAPIPDSARLPLSTSSHKLVRTAIEEAYALHHNWVGSEHLLLSLCVHARNFAVSRTLSRLHVRADSVRSFIEENMARIESTDEPTSGN